MGYTQKPPTAQSQARERAWLRRQMGYLRGDFNRAVDLLEKRMSQLEDLLRPRDR